MSDLDTIKQLAEEVGAMRVLLRQALELAEEGINYTPEYFNKKWGLSDEWELIAQGARDLGVDNV